MIYRDRSTRPVPHISADAHTAGLADPETHTPEDTSPELR